MPTESKLKEAIMKSKIILINGICASGKSTLAQDLSNKFKIPLIMKDQIKETLFDTLACKNIEKSQKLGLASMELLYSMLSNFLKTNNCCIVEANFMKKFAEPVFLDFKKNYDFDLIQIICECNHKIAFKRHTKRKRHKGHFDSLRIKESNGEFRNKKVDFFDIKGKKLKIRTDDFSSKDYQSDYNSVVNFFTQIGL